MLIPMACSLFGVSGDVAMQAVAAGFIIGVVQDSIETALNSAGDAFLLQLPNTLNGKKKVNRFQHFLVEQKK